MIRSLLFATAFIAGTLTVSAQTEKFLAVQEDGQTINFTENKFGTDNLAGEIVAGKTIKTIDENANVLEWNDANISTTKKIINGVNESIDFCYVNASGIPYVSYGSEKVVSSGGEVSYRATYTYYTVDGNNGLPTSGLYYKLTPKKNGSLKIGVWVNKSYRETILFEESTKLPIAYTAEGYVNGQNTEDGKNKFLTNDDLKALHEQGVANNFPITDYVIGMGNQAFWGWITANVEANKTYYLLIPNGQIGFQGYEFTPEGTTGVAKTSAVSEDEAIYTINGIQTNNLISGKIYIKGGKKFIAK
ncbi:MAG: hypothetical protein J5676_07345 [Bacteroidaceae bacterium]|nr:hypothetical protein [Bacteroidaceae bacterium]